MGTSAGIFAQYFSNTKIGDLADTKAGQTKRKRVMGNPDKNPTVLSMSLVEQSFSDGGLKMWAALSQCGSEALTACIDLSFAQNESWIPKRIINLVL